MTDRGLGRRYWTLWAAFTTANLGDGLSLVAFPLLAVSLTDDARLVAFVSMCRFLAFPLLGLPAGVVIDRFDRRILAIIAQLGRAGALGVVAALLATDAATIPALAAAAFVVGAGEVITDGGLPAVVRAVVAGRDLEVANSRLSASQTVANMIVGPPTSALLFEIDPALPFIAAGGLYLVAVGFLTALPGPFRSDAELDTGTLLHRMTRGLRYVWDHPVLRPLALVVAVFAFFGEAGHSIFVILVTERIGLGNVGFGVLLAVDAVAAVATSFVVAPLVARTGHSFSMRLSVVLFAASSVVLGTVTLVGAVAVAMVLGGASNPTWNIVSTTVRQRLVPDAIFGRMMTAYLLIAWGIQPFGALAGGVIAEEFGPEWVYLMSSLAVGSLLVVGQPMYRRVDEALAATPVDAR